MTNPDRDFLLSDVASFWDAEKVRQFDLFLLLSLLCVELNLSTVFAAEDSTFFRCAVSVS